MIHKVTLRPSGDVVEIDSETNLLEALKENDIYIKSSCGGHASCSDCSIKIVSGEDNLTPPSFEEIQLLGNVFHITKERLSCQTKITGDVSIDISSHDRVADEEKLRSKTSGFKKPKLRKKDEVSLLKEEKVKARDEKDKAKAEKPAEKRLDGNRRPKDKFKIKSKSKS